MTSPTVPQSVLVYDRIAQNRLKTVLLVIIAIASVVPFVGGISYGAADFLVRNFGPHRHMSKQQEQMLREALTPPARAPGEMTNEFELTFEKEMQKQLDAEARARRSPRRRPWASFRAAPTCSRRGWTNR